MRLGGIGSTEKEGYVEARGTNGVWGGICDDAFGMDDAHVICRMLGFLYATAFFERAQQLVIVKGC